MDKNLEAILFEWNFIRSCSISFINDLSDADLDRILPRKGLNTFRKHFQEMIEVQNDYLVAISNSKMAYNGTPDSQFDGNFTKEQLLDNMKSLDSKLEEVLESINENAYVEWFGKKLPLSFHLSAMISHESMHIGQIIAFCYALDIQIPNYIIENWALSGK